ncbi:MAG: hypothetical protein ACPG4J_05610 [Lentibacter algarum]
MSHRKRLPAFNWMQRCTASLVSDVYAEPERNARGGKFNACDSALSKGRQLA